MTRKRIASIFVTASAAVTVAGAIVYIWVPGCVGARISATGFVVLVAAIMTHEVEMEATK